MHELALPLLIGLIVLALAFDFLNGLHDAANCIATVVATKLLRPVQAVAFAAFFNFAAYFLTLAWPQLHAVADTIGKGLIDKDMVTPAVVFGALVGAMFWNVVTWLKGIPSSSSHALVGGIVGAGLAAAGLGTIQWTGLSKTLLSISLAPTARHDLSPCWSCWCPAGCRQSLGPRRRSGPSVRCIWCHRPPIRSATASTMPRRRWGSSPSCSIRPAICTASSMCRTGSRSAAISRSASAP